MKYTLLFFILIYSCISFAQKSHSEIYDVQEYNIFLDITDIEGEYIEGHTTIRLTPLEENTEIYEFDLLKLEIDSIISPDSEVDNFTYNDTLITVDLATAFGTTDEITIDIYYHGNPVTDPSGWGGLYFMDGYAFNMGVAIEDIPHNYGRVWFPCNDDFVDKAIYKTYITTQEEHTAVCGGELIQIIENGNNTKTYEWHLDQKIPTYLMSVSVGVYELQSHIYEGIESDIPVDFYIYPGDSANIAQSFINIDSVLSIFETKFGAYPWNRVGYVEVPFNGGAMEHVTNIAMGHAFIDGTLDYETLFYHELAHMWFGDMITCSSAEDMWINEGWATFCETVFQEFLYSPEQAKAYRRSAHETVLRYYHIQDGGFHALYPMDQSLTYSRTVYEKGASVAHALRGYLGDDVFFPAITQFLQENIYSSVSSYDMRDFLTSYTGTDMTDFFEDWVFSPGFVHFAIDSTQITENEGTFEVTVYVHQKLRGRETYANSNKIEISFMKPDYTVQTEIMEFDGEFGEQIYTLSFEPKLILCDYNEILSDATIDETKFIKSTGAKHYTNTYFYADVQTVNPTDSSMCRITHNWVAPDPFINDVPGLVLANHRHWTVEGIFKDGFKAKGKFSYNQNASNFGYVDYGFITNSTDSLVLLYRPNKITEWTIEEFSHSNALKRLTVDSLKIGEYSLGIWDWDVYTDIQNKISIGSLADIYPNPNEGNFYLKTEIKNTGTVQIINSSGAIVYEDKILETSSDIYFSVTDLPDGLYFMRINNHKNGTSIIKKFIIQK